jgi:hypothetical protein
VSTEVDHRLELIADSRRFKRSERSVHIHNCARRKMAGRLHVSESDLRYCYECMTWCPQSEWRGHCGYHLQSWADRHCEVVIYRYTVIRPGYCPCCLWNQGLPADERLKYWLRSANLRRHVEQHIEKAAWPTADPVCGCSQSFASERDFRYHLHDVHGLADGIWKPGKSTSKRKRDTKTEAASIEDKPQEPKTKKIQFRHYQPPNQHLQAADSRELSTPTQTRASVSKPAIFTFWEYPCPPSYSSSSAPSSPVSESGTAGISAPTSPLSSLRTTPDLELIDPRILDPLWPGNGAPPSIGGTCDASGPAAYVDGDAGIAHEELTDDPTIVQFDALHIESHQIGHEGSGVTTDTTPANTSARGDVHSSSPYLGSRDEPSDCSLAGDVQSTLLAKDPHQTSSASEGPVTRARARAEQTGGPVKPHRKRQHLFTPKERRTAQVLKGQNLARDQVKSYLS